LSYRIEFVRSAAKAYARLDPTLQRRVDRELTRLGETPRHPGVIRLQSDDEL
jgi:mRNA-degrading endonuclease RelE of RelBE toxin-antitoxin system